jgi:hypothetical protein
VRTYRPELLRDVRADHIQPIRVFDLELTPAQAPEA